MSAGPKAARSNRIYTALATEYGALDPDEMVVDAMTDLKHFCDRWGLDFGRCNRIAQSQYMKEI